MPKVKDIAKVIEKFAPRDLQENYDNAGLQVGNPDMEVRAALLCLDVTEDILQEAKARECNMIISHHPLLFKGLKEITGSTPTEKIVMNAIRDDIAIYSAHTNLDKAQGGVSHEMAHLLNLKEVRVLEPAMPDSKEGLGLVGTIKPTPKLEFLRKIKELFNVKCLKYSSQSPQLVIKKVAVCGGAGASLIEDAVKENADIYVTGDVKYHDFTTFGHKIIITDIGHYESELGSRKILMRIIKDSYPEFDIYISDKETNPINYM